MISEYIDRVAQQVLHSKVDIKSIVLEQFKSVTTEMSPMESLATACRLISKRLIYDNLTLRKQMVGEFIQTIRSIIIITTISGRYYFWRWFTYKYSEPYFAEVAYKVSSASEITVIDHDNRCLATKKNVSIENSNAVDLIYINIYKQL